METHDDEHMLTMDEKIPTKKISRRVIFWLLLFLTPIICLYVYAVMISPSKAFLPDTYIEIPKGHTLSETSILLKERSIIRSETIFLFVVQRAGKEKGIQSGTYFFKEPASVFEVARRVMKAEYGIEQLKITLPEGITNKEMGDILTSKLPALDLLSFESLTREKEGYLFPDTYFFYTNATSGPVVMALEENFKKQTESIKREALDAGKDWKHIVIIASLLEEEAATQKDRELVAGIIEKRLEKKMPLQIDATLGYVTGRGSLELTVTDLRSESPYNTYTHRGLPPTPISNPGVDALKAALYPVSSPYLYYLSDKEGVIHYAKTFEEHKLNKTKYLR